MDRRTLLITVFCLIDDWLTGQRVRQRAPVSMLADAVYTKLVTATRETVMQAQRALRCLPGSAPGQAGRSPAPMATVLDRRLPAP